MNVTDLKKGDTLICVTPNQLMKKGEKFKVEEVTEHSAQIITKSKSQYFIFDHNLNQFKKK